MNEQLREEVRTRAAYRCEYCLIPESALHIAFHIEHIRARQHGGSDDLDNLALACDRCNLHKGPNLSSIDPESDLVVELYHPRRDAWDSHFQLCNADIAGRTPTGRATVRLLQMNATRRLRLRGRLLAENQW